MGEVAEHQDCGATCVWDKTANTCVRSFPDYDLSFKVYGCILPMLGVFMLEMLVVWFLGHKFAYVLINKRSPKVHPGNSYFDLVSGAGVFVAALAFGMSNTLLFKGSMPGQYDDYDYWITMTYHGLACTSLLMDFLSLVCAITLINYVFFLAMYMCYLLITLFLCCIIVEVSGC